MIAVLLFVLSMFGYTVFYKACFKKMSLGLSLFMAYGSMSFLMYLFLIFSFLKVGAYFVIGIGFILLVFFFSKARIQKAEWLSPAFLFFLLTLLCLLTLTIRQKVYVHDDFSHWMKAVKQMVDYDAYFVPYTPLEEVGYMPAFIPICYAMTRLFGYKEGVVYIIKSLGLISLLSWFIEMISKTTEDRKKSWLASILSICIFFLFPIFNTYSYGFNTLLVDMELGVYFAVGLIYAITQKELFPIFILTTNLSLLKLGTGVMFSYLIIAARLLKELDLKNRALWVKRIKEKQKSILLLILLLLLPIGLNMSWKICYNQNKVISNHREVTKDLSVEYALRSPMDSYKKTIIREYIQNIYQFKNAFTREMPVLYYVILFLLVSAFLFLSLPREDKKQIRKMFGYLGVGSILFLIGLYVIYVNFIRFSSEEYRYTGTCLMAFMMIFAYISGLHITRESKHQKKALILILSVIFVVALSCNPIQYLHIWYKPETNVYYFTEEHRKAKEMSATFSDVGMENQDRILYISENESSLFIYAMEYDSLPRRVRYLNMSEYSSIERVIDYFKQYEVNYVVLDLDRIERKEVLRPAFGEDLEKGGILIYKLNQVGEKVEYFLCDHETI